MQAATVAILKQEISSQFSKLVLQFSLISSTSRWTESLNGHVHWAAKLFVINLAVAGY